MAEKWDCHTLVVGGGVSGLAAAQVLHEAGVDWLLVEKEEALGGRVRTDPTESGFLLDRGFQVLNTAYPALSRVVSLDGLGLKEFAPGAEVFWQGKFHRIGDPLRRPEDLVPTVLAPVGGLGDKLKILELVRFCARPGSAAAVEGVSSEEFLAQFGFSEAMVERFFRPFFGGVFLEEELMTSAHKFVTLFSYFSRGRAALPSAGMQALPSAMAERLPAERLKTGQALVACKAGKVETGEAKIKARQVILAGWEAQRIVLGRPRPSTHSAHTVWFSRASSRGQGDGYLRLNGSREGLIQTVAFNSAVQPTYAPSGRDLVVVSTRREASLGVLKEELMGWFGESVKEWEVLRSDLVQQALPQEHSRFSSIPRQSHEGFEIWSCGDHTETGSLQGAITSGRKAGQAALGLAD